MFFFVRKQFSALKVYLTSFVRFERKLGWREVAVLGGIIVGVVGTLIFVGGGSDVPAPRDQGPRGVEVRSVADLSTNSSPLPLVGIVRSQSEAQVRTESSGQIVRVYRELGDYAAAGSIIAEMENSSQRAAVLQAEGSFDAAQAGLLKVKGGARDEQLSILRTNFESAEVSLATAKTSAVNALLSSYATNDEAVRRKADAMFSNADTSAPQFNVTITDSQLATDLATLRVRLRTILMRQDSVGASLSSEAELESELVRTESETREVKNFLDKLTSALNKAVPSSTISETTVATYKADANAARTAVTSSLSSLSTAKDTLSGKRAAVEVARKNLEQGVVGGQAEDVAAAQAQVKQSQGTLAAARASLERTIIRAPISGTINALPIERGDFVSAFTPAATIANNNALEIETFVTERDSREIKVGASVAIEGGLEGVVTRIAPALDPLTKKIEVRVGITSKDAHFLNGQAITIEVKREGGSTFDGRMIVPLSALKVGTESTVVFAVNEDLTLTAHPVALGELLGDKVVIEGGVTPELRIVTDARGLREGEKVILK